MAPLALGQYKIFQTKAMKVLIGQYSCIKTVVILPFLTLYAAKHLLAVALFVPAV